MQRIRVGLTGLGLVMLLVLVAAAGLKPARSVAHAIGSGETLSALGVAPSQGPASTIIVTDPRIAETQTPEARLGPAPAREANRR